MLFWFHFYLQFQDFQLKVEQAVQACQEFSKLYYETVDKKRHVSPHLFVYKYIQWGFLRPPDKSA